MFEAPLSTPAQPAPAAAAAYEELATARAQLAAATASQAGLAEEVAALRAALAGRNTEHAQREHTPEADVEVEPELEPATAPVPSPEPVRGGAMLRMGGVPSGRPVTAPVPEGSFDADEEHSGVASVFRSRLAAVERSAAAAGSSPLAQFNALRERIMSNRNGGKA